jgi:hypothetical protein
LDYNGQTLGLEFRIEIIKSTIFQAVPSNWQEQNIALVRFAACLIHAQQCDIATKSKTPQLQMTTPQMRACMSRCACCEQRHSLNGAYSDFYFHFITLKCELD